MLPLLIVDLDGTLIDHSGQVHPSVWQNIATAREEGMQFAVCTGRPCMGIAQEIAERLAPQGWHIFQNGALICKPDGQALKTFALNETLLKGLIEHARQHQLTLEAYTPSEVFIERQSALAMKHAAVLGVTPIVRNLMEVAAEEPVVRAQWVVDDEGFSLTQGLELADIQRGDATSPAMPEAHFSSLTQVGVSKGSAVRILAENLGIALAEIMAIGDSFGDVSMLEIVGHPIVMGNAPAALRERFPSVSDVEEKGVIAAIEQAFHMHA